MSRRLALALDDMQGAIADIRALLAGKMMADLGNQLRHAYHRILPERLWAIHEGELDTLERAVARMLDVQRNP